MPPPPATSSAPFIRRRLCWDSFSGHVSWPPVNITMNPFLLFMQTFFLGTAGTIGAGADSVCSVFPAHRFGECAQALEHKLESSDWIPPLPATSSAPFIRLLCWDSFRRHVSWPPVNITMNPFLLFMQTFFLGTAGTIGAGADSVCSVFPAHRFGECAQALEHKLESSDWMPPPPCDIVGSLHKKTPLLGFFQWARQLAARQHHHEPFSALYADFLSWNGGDDRRRR
ncbi:hypothetical protein MTO96_042177 [Rhipicephalus appendiculatus]